MCKNISLSTLSGSNEARSLVTVRPATEKARSLGISVAGIARYLIAN